MQRTNIRISGRVQGVGLRVRIKTAADEIGVRGTVENLDDGSVLVVCEAERVGWTLEKETAFCMILHRL